MTRPGVCDPQSVSDRTVAECGKSRHEPVGDMTTKLPINDNQVTTPSSALRRRRDEGGIALISVIAVLVLLAMVATPFLLTMRDSAARGEKYLYSNRADAEAEALFETVRSQLISGLESVEHRKLGDVAPSAIATAQDPPADATPDYDTPAEFEMPKSVLDRFNQSTAKEHRVWDADVTDTQSLFNINNCSLGVLANILGRAEVAAPTTSDKQTIPLDRVPDSFPKTDGVVRIGTECVKYKQIVGNALINCERGFAGSSAGNGPAHDLELADAVMLESAYQIATRPYRLRTDKDGHPVWVRYTHVDQARTIGDLGVTTLPPQDFERLRPYITAWNGNEVGDGWANPQLVRNSITAGNVVNLYAQIKNIRYFGPGTMVRITDGIAEDYAMVAKVTGTDQITLAGKITHDYTADQTRIYCLARSPINVNTADVSTLSLCFQGLHVRGKSSFITDRQADDIAAYLKTWTRPVPAGSSPTAAQAAPGVFRGFEDLTRALEAARDAGKMDQDGFEAVMRNALNANDSNLGYSTVPFSFRSHDTYEVRATVSIQGAGGHELARRELRRVMEVSSTRSGTFVIETQDGFQNQIIKSRDAKYMATFPVNVNSQYDNRNIPASEYKPYTTGNRFPSTDRSVGVSSVQLLPAAFRTTLGNRKDNVQHFDNERIPDGFELKDNTFLMSVDSPYAPAFEDSTKKGTADLVDIGTIDGVGTDIEFGMKEFACSFWYRPDWDRNQADQVIFDYGDSKAGDDHMNRVSLRYDKQRDALVLGVCGATREKRTCEVLYNFDHGTWISKEWYHIGCHVHGCAPGMMELFVDGNQVGRNQDICRLGGGITGQGKTGDLQSKDDTKSFPPTGVLLLRGKDGIELMEYSQNTGKGFVISRRKARSVVDTIADTTSISHAEGDTVELYGFTAPLLTDIKKGGATLDASLGPWRAYRMIAADTLIDGNGAKVATGLAGQVPGTTTVPQKIGLAEWDTGSTDASVIDDLGPANTHGIAVLISQNLTRTGSALTVGLAPSDTSGSLVSKQQSPTALGGVDIVEYSVDSSATPPTVTLVQRGLTLKHFQVNVTDGTSGGGLPRFLFTHQFGDTGANPTLSINGGPFQGLLAAFIPIGVLAQAGSSAEYLDPLDKEPQLKGTNYAIKNKADTNLNDGHAYIQIDGEWVAYDAIDTNVISGKVAFYRDQHLDRLAQAMFAYDANNLVKVAPQAQPSTGQGGGSGGNSTSTPDIATEKNIETNLPPDVVVTNPANGNQTQPQVGTTDFTTILIAQNLDFRGVINTAKQIQHRIANTLPPATDHAAGVPILPTFLTVTGNSLESTLTQNDGAVFAYPGFNDLLTLRDVKGNDEEVRVQWGYMGWCGLTAATSQSWFWDRPQGIEFGNALRHHDARAFTRALKYPCGEMPDGALTKAKQDIIFGKKYDNSGSVSKATIDEVYFPQFHRAVKDRVDYAFVGIVPTEVADPTLTTQTSNSGTSGTPPPPIVFPGITKEDTEFNVHLTVPDQSGRLLTYGTPIDANTFAPDGGVVMIDDELILYEQIDASTGKFTNCVRGAFGTDQQPHNYSARVIPIWTFPCSRLTSGIDTTSGTYQLENTADFPDDGYIRIGLSNEMIGYTNWEVGRLTAPLGRLTGTNDTPKAVRDTTKSEKLQGGSIFRSRFGTIAQTAAAGEIAVAVPFRVYDRYAEMADDPEQSYLQLSWTKHGAIWKRITWNQLPKTDVEVVALVRFSGGPLWDDSKSIIHVGQNSIPTDDRRKYLYQITDPTAINLLNVEADRIEVRIGVRFVKGAYDSLATVAPDHWKETPEIRGVKIEYVAPPQVLTQE